MSAAENTEAKATVFLEENHDLPLVELVLVARTGASQDPVGKEGALALGMRTLRRGTATRTSVEIDAAVDRLGAELGTSTDTSSVAIHATVLRRNLEPFLDVLADVVVTPAFPPEQVAHVVRETRAAIIDTRNDDRTLASRAFYRTLFAGHPYGRPANGTLASLSNLSAGDARTAYSQAFRSSNIVFGAAGDITAKELNTIVRERFGTLPTGAAPSLELPEPTVAKGRRLVIVDKPARTQTQVFIGGLGTHPYDKDHTALQVGNTIFGGTFTARLMREVRSKRGWSYGASSRLGRDRVRDAWYMWTFPAATDVAACIKLQLGLLEELLDKGVTEREVSFVKKYLARGYAFEVDTAGKRLGQRIDEAVVPLPRRYYANYVARIEAVTRDQVNAALRKRLSADNLLVTVVATASEMRGALEGVIPGLAETRVIPYDSDELPLPG